jgi:hypothetical protein
MLLPSPPGRSQDFYRGFPASHYKRASSRHLVILAKYKSYLILIDNDNSYYIQTKILYINEKQ